LQQITVFVGYFIAVLLISQMTFFVNIMFVLQVSLRAEYMIYCSRVTDSWHKLLVKFFAQLLLTFCYFFVFGFYCFLLLAK